MATTQKMKFPADLVTFTEEIINGKLHFLWSWYRKFLCFTSCYVICNLLCYPVGDLVSFVQINVLLLVILQASTCNFVKNNTTPCQVFIFFNSANDKASHIVSWKPTNILNLKSCLMRYFYSLRDYPNERGFWSYFYAYCWILLLYIIFNTEIMAWDDKS